MGVLRTVFWNSLDKTLWTYELYKPIFYEKK